MQYVYNHLEAQRLATGVPVRTVSAVAKDRDVVADVFGYVSVYAVLEPGD